MDCPPEICQGMTQPHEELLFGSRPLLFYPPTTLKPITEKFVVFSNSSSGGDGGGGGGFLLS